MTKSELLKKIDEHSMDCWILDDKEINPLEILIIASNKRKMKSLLNKNSVCQVTDGDRDRLACVRSFSEVNVDLNKFKFSRMEPYQKLYTFEKTEEDILWFVYSVVLAKRDNWLRRNTISVLSSRHCLGECDEKKVNEWLKMQCERLGVPLPCRSFIGQIGNIRYRLFRKVSFNYMGRRNIIHNKLTRKKFFVELKKQGVISTRWKEIVGSGLSGCTYIQIWKEQECIFLKGNAPSDISGIKNEINAQKLLLRSKCDSSHFISAVDYSEENGWICFPYMSNSSLGDVLKGRELKKGELELLFDFLVSILDELYAFGIVHNDIRPENILVETNEVGEIYGYKLTDFGCFSIRGNTPWNTGKRLEKLYCMEMCGNSRYNNFAVDDAAAAAYLYQLAGGCDEQCIEKLHKQIGKSFTYIC